MSTKKIKVLGSGCKKCGVTTERVRAVAQELGVKVEVEKVEDFAEIARFGVMATPSVVVDGAVVHVGSVPTLESIAAWIR